jgi:uncharacterized surface protein with fasciclin (FAS1) repeats
MKIYKVMNALKVKIIQPVLVLLGVFLLVACEDDGKQEVWEVGDEMVLIQYLESQRDFSYTVEALKKTYVYNTLSTYGPYTFFCPTDEAWEKFFSRNNYSGIDNIEESFLEALFEYHVLPFEKRLENMENGPMSLADTTISGQRLLLDISGGLDSIVVNNQAVISHGNIETWNGVIHEMNDVLDPPIMLAGDYLKSNSEFSSFVSFLESQEVFDVLMVKYSSVYPYLAHEFSVFALDNNAMEDLQPAIDSLSAVDARYDSEVARDPDYALKVMPDQVRQLARSFILDGVDYVSTMYSGFKKTLGEIPYGDGQMRMKVVASENSILINDQSQLLFEDADVIVENGLVHHCRQAFVFLPESPREFVYSAWPMERWNTNLGAMVSSNNTHGYLGDSENVYGIVNLEPERVGAEFWVNVPNVPAGKYALTLITKKQGSKAQILVNDEILSFEGTEADGSYDFSYLLGNRGRVDDLNPNPCSKGGLQLFEVPTGIVEVSSDQTEVTVKFLVTYLNPGGPKIALSAILFQPLAE